MMERLKKKLTAMQANVKILYCQNLKICTFADQGLHCTAKSSQIFISKLALEEDLVIFWAVICSLQTTRKTMWYEYDIQRFLNICFLVLGIHGFAGSVSEQWSTAIHVLLGKKGMGEGNKRNHFYPAEISFFYCL